MQKQPEVKVYAVGTEKGRSVVWAMVDAPHAGRGEGRAGAAPGQSEEDQGAEQAGRRRK